MNMLINVLPHRGSHITLPGFYPNMPAAQYHADPCTDPSLSSSIAKVLIDQSPQHAWYSHPRLNPSHKESDDAKFDLGSAAHAILFGAGRELCVIDEEDYRKTAAKASRDDAIANGLQPILARQHQQAIEMAAITHRNLSMVEGCEDFFGSEADGVHVFNELMIAWHDEGGIWCRALIDRLCISKDAMTVYDLKTTGTSAAPHEVGRYQYNMHHEIQAAFYERGLQTLISSPVADRLKVRFIVQETDKPYALTVNEVDLTIGRKEVSQAVHMWGSCLKAKNWPGYPRQVLKQYMPGFMETKWLEREANDPSIRSFMDDQHLLRSGWVPETPTKEKPETLLAG